MYEAMHTYSEFKPPNEEDQRLLRLYGKIPTRGDLLQHQLEVSTRCTLLLTSLDPADPAIHSRKKVF